MRRYFTFVTSHPVWVLGLASAPALVLGLWMFRLTRDTSPDAFIPKDHPALAIKREVDRQFGLSDPVVVGVIREAEGGVFVPHTLQLIWDLTRTLQKEPGIKPSDVMSLATESGVLFEEGVPGFEPLMKEVPQDAAGCQAVKNDILAYELYQGTLVSADGTAAAIVIRLEDESRADELYRELNRLVSGFPVQDERLVVAGEAAVRAHMGRAVSDDALRMNFICPVVMAFLIILAYRTVRGTVLPLAVIAGASALALGSMAATRVPIYIVTNGIFVIIMALSVDNSFHLLGQYYEEQLHLRGRSKQEVIIDACRVLWYPMAITSLTDLAGFMGLYVGGMMPPIESFGLFTCIGVLAALFYVNTLIPAGLMLRPLHVSHVFVEPREAEGEAAHGDVVARMLDRLGAFVWRRPWVVLGAGAVVLGFAGWGATKLVINDARILAFKDHHPLVQASRILNEHFDGTSQLNIRVTASEKGAFLKAENLRKIDDLEAFTEKLPLVGGTHSLAGWVKRAHQKMHEEDPKFYAVPEDPSDTQFYLGVLGAETSPMARSLRECIDPTYTVTNLIVRMRSSEYIHQRPVILGLEKYLKEHFSDGPLKTDLAGRVNLDYHWLSMIGASHLRSVVPSLAWVLVLCGLMFRSVTAGLLCTFTAGVAVVINYALMGLGGIPLGVGSSMFASIAIGAGVNFPVHILERFRNDLRVPGAEPEHVFRETFAFTGRPLFFTALVVGAGFLLLCVSQFRTLVEFGSLIGTALVVSFLASVTVLPAAVAAFRPRFVFRHTAQGGFRRVERGWR